MGLPSEGLEMDEPEIYGERESSPDIVELSAVNFFSLALQNSQKWHSAAKGPRKRMHASHHSRKSDRTIRRHKKAKRELEAQGFFSLAEFFRQKAESARQQGAVGAVRREGECNKHDKHKDKATEHESEDMASARSAEGDRNPCACSRKRSSRSPRLRR
jgi:hypothetical protein